jgi:hypothetical protein
MPALTPADVQTRPSLTKIAFGSTVILGKLSASLALAVQRAGPGQHERSEAHRCHASRFRQHLRNPFHQGAVLPQLPYARAARNHQRIDLVGPNAGDRRGIDHHSDVGWHQPTRGRQIRQRIARARQLDLLQFREHLRRTGNIEQGHPRKGDDRDALCGRLFAQVGSPGFGRFRGHIVL